MKQSVVTLIVAIPILWLCTVANAEQRTARFEVDRMTCAMCPITVRKAMQQVTGVRSVTVDLDTKTATVVYEASAATPAQIAAASRDAGYPAREKP